MMLAMESAPFFSERIAPARVSHRSPLIHAVASFSDRQRDGQITHEGRVIVNSNYAILTDRPPPIRVVSRDTVRACCEQANEFAIIKNGTHDPAALPLGSVQHALGHAQHFAHGGGIVRAQTQHHAVCGLQGPEDASPMASAYRLILTLAQGSAGGIRHIVRLYDP